MTKTAIGAKQASALRGFRFSAAAFAALFTLAACGSTNRFGQSEVSRPGEDGTSRRASALSPSAFYPGVSSCVAAHPAQPAYAAYAVATDEDRVEVYTVGRDGSVYDCKADAGGGRPTTNERTTAIDLSRPAFYPASGAAPGAACIGTPREPVYAADGRLVGWLSWPAC